MGILKKYFDKIYCITSKKDNNRKSNIIKQLKELDELDNISFYYYEDNNKWHFNFHFCDDLLQEFNMTVRLREISCAKSHLNCVIDAYQNNYNNILIIEDDVYFLKSIEEQIDLLNNMPNDYDIIRFAWPLFTYTKEYNRTLINECCTGAYALSKRAIKEYMNNQLKLTYKADYFAKIFDLNDFKMYYSNIPLAFPFDDVNLFKKWIKKFNDEYIIKNKNKYFEFVNLCSSIRNT